MRVLTYYLLLITLNIISVTLVAQQFSYEWGKITDYERDMTSYSKDKNAEALVIYDKGSSVFIRDDYNYNLLYKRKTKIKILTKAGLAFAEFSIPYYYHKNNIEVVKKVKGITYNFDNGIITRTEFKENNLYDEKINDYWRQKKFAMPNVHEGSIIEIEYIIETPNKFNFRDWEFQREIPTVYSEYLVKMIPFYEYVFVLQGAKKFDDYKSYKDNSLPRQYGSIEFQDLVHKYVMEDIPAFKDESYISSRDDYIMKVDFQLAKINSPDGSSRTIITTWPDMANDLLKDALFGRYINVAEKFVKKEIPNFTNLEDKESQIYAITDYVKTNYNWDGYYGEYAYENLKEFRKTKSGNAGNLNLFLLGALKTAGFEAYPVLISTRGNGKIWKTYPFVDKFNYVIVKVNTSDKSYLLDATEPLCDNSFIPTRCINDIGFVIYKDSEEFITLAHKEPSITKEEIYIEIFEDTPDITAKIKQTSTGYLALNARRKFENEEDGIKDLINNRGLDSYSDLSIENLNEPPKPFIINFSTKQKLMKIDSLIYLEPFLGGSLSEVPFKANKRYYPVDMIYPNGNEFNTTIQLPSDDYRLVEMLDSINHDNNLINIILNTYQEGNKIIIQGSYLFKKSIYTPKEYGRIKYYFTDIAKQFNRKIAIYDPDI